LTVDFLPFANDASSANVVSQADYLIAASSSGYVQNGFSSGTAASNQANKAIRQSSVMTAALAQFLAARLSQDVLDSGGAASVTAIQAQILAAIQASTFPAGTPLLFPGISTAPVGWTKSTTHNDKMLRIVSGTAGTGGSAAMSTAWTSVALSGTVGGHTLTSAEIPSHTHSGTTGTESVTHTHGFTFTVAGGANDYPLIGAAYGATGSVTTSTQSAYHTHSITTDGGTGGGGSHTHGLTMNALTVTPAYVDAIICIKN
jgi:hypothetical protein